MGYLVGYYLFSLFEVSTISGEDQATLELNLDKKAKPLLVKEMVSKILHPISEYKTNRALKLYGLLDSGEEVGRLVGENVTNFGSESYDDFVNLLPDSLWRDFSSCKAVERLEVKIFTLKSAFGSVPTPDSWKILSAKPVITVERNSK